MYTNFSTMQDCLLKWLVFTFGHNWRESFDKWKAVCESGECDQLTTRQPLIRWGFCAQIKVRCGLIRLGSDCQWHGLHAHNRNISVSRPVCPSQWYDSPLLCDPFKPRLNRNCKVSIYISLSTAGMSLSLGPVEHQCCQTWTRLLNVNKVMD